MTMNERIVLAAVKKVCEERREAKRYPATALFVEVQRYTPGITREGLIDALQKLTQEGKLREYATVNSKAYEPLAKD